MSIVNDSEKGSFKAMLKARLKGLIYNATPNSKYASGGYQDVMSSGMGLDSMFRILKIWGTVAVGRISGLFTKLLRIGIW